MPDQPPTNGAPIRRQARRGPLSGEPFPVWCYLASHSATRFCESARASGSAAERSGAAASVPPEAALTGSLGRLFAVAEAYPDLKANQTMNTLMGELTSTEDKVAYARQGYNESVMTYNTARETFPTNFVAGMFHFEPAQLFEIEQPGEREAPKVSFS